jgi:hypothetical protein
MKGIVHVATSDALRLVKRQRAMYRRLSNLRGLRNQAA